MVWPTPLYSSFTLLFISSKPGSALEPLIQLVTSTLDTRHKILTRRSPNFLHFKATNKHNKSPPCLFARLPVTPTHPAFSLKHFAQLSSGVCTPLVTVQTVNHNHRGSLFIRSLRASCVGPYQQLKTAVYLAFGPRANNLLSSTLTFPSLSPHSPRSTLPAGASPYLSASLPHSPLFSTKRNHFFRPKPAHYLEHFYLPSPFISRFPLRRRTALSTLLPHTPNIT